MYCVRCGVRLQDGVPACPLCGTPVWNPDEHTGEKSYPDTLPRQYRETTVAYAVIMTILCLISAVTIMAVCLKLYGTLSWGSYAIGGIGLFYILAVLPSWFRNPREEVFIPLDHTAAALYVLLICVQTGGHWFLSFAFPLLGMSCVLITALTCLLKHLKKGKPFILGGFLILLGGATMLAEFFEHITFGSRMFLWSPYTMGILGASGIFLLIAGFVPPLRQAMRRYFFY